MKIEVIKVKVNKKISIEMTKEEYDRINVALSICQEFECLFDKVDDVYKNKFSDTVDILLDIINCEGKFSCDKEEA